MSGGVVFGFLEAYEDASITLSGGTLRGSLGAYQASVLAFLGSGFEVDGTPVGYRPLSAESSILTGVLESGDSLAADFERNSTAAITLVPEPALALLQLTALALLLPRALRGAGAMGRRPSRAVHTWSFEDGSYAGRAPGELPGDGHCGVGQIGSQCVLGTRNLAKRGKPCPGWSFGKLREKRRLLLFR